jgi:hypothetical protein
VLHAKVLQRGLKLWLTELTPHCKQWVLEQHQVTNHDCEQFMRGWHNSMTLGTLSFFLCYRLLPGATGGSGDLLVRRPTALCSPSCNCNCDAYYDSI